MKRLLLPTLLMALLLWPVVFAQTQQAKVAAIGSALVKAKLDQVDTLIAQQQIETALRRLDTMLTVFQEGKNWPFFQEAIHKYAVAYTQQDSFQAVHQKVSEALDILDEADMSDSLVCASLWFCLGMNHQRQDAPVEALACYRRAIQLYEQHECQGSEVVFAYQNAAQILMRFFDNREAVQLLEAAVRADSSGQYLSSLYDNLANTYLRLDSLNRASAYFELAIQLEPDLAAFYTTGAAIALQKGRLNEAQLLTLRAMDLFKALPSGAENRLLGFTLLAEIAQKKKQPGLAMRYYQQGFAAARVHFPNRHQAVARLWVSSGEFYQSRKQTARALECYQQALIQCFPSFQSTDLRDNPPLQEVPLELQALRAATGKARILLQMNLRGQADQERRLNVAHCFELAFAVAARLRHTYRSDADQPAQTKALRPDYCAAALNLQALYKATGQTIHLERLFALIEQSKAQALTDALQQQSKLALAGIPDSLLEKEQHLRLAAVAIAQEVKQFEFSGDSSTFSIKKVSELKIQKQYDAFLSQLQKQFPPFRVFLEAETPASLAALRQALADTTAFLSWFDAGDRYLSLCLYRGQLHSGTVLRDTAFERKLSGFTSLLTDLKRQKADPPGFLTTAAFLGEKLLPAASADARKLLVAPDGLLCYLPFDVLLTAPATRHDYAAAPYLLRRSAVAYVWSAQLLSLPPAALRTDGLAHFAPFSGVTPRNLPALTHTLEDVPETVGADRLEGPAATVLAFKTQAAAYRTLHLSTHAHTGRVGEPGIEFFDRMLPMQEIYAMRLRASMICLSASETGTGAFGGGEGVLGLARAFAYAGAQSLVASLWQVNDHRTARLFAGFYGNLQQGMSKSEALRRAKLSALDDPESGPATLPFYWAAFTLNGADGTVELPGRWAGLWGWMLAGLLLSLVVFWGARRVGRKKR